MASIRLKFRPSRINENEGVIYYQVVHTRRTRQWSSGYRVLKEEWDRDKARLRISPGNDRMNYLFSIKQKIKWDIERLSTIVDRFQKDGQQFTCENIIQTFSVESLKHSFIYFMKDQIIKLKEMGKVRTSETYTTALNSFMRFRNNEDIPMEGIDTDLMERYQAYLKTKGLVPNTISFHMRILRAVFNRAVEKGITVDRKPFRRVYTGIDKTTKRALPIKTIKRILGIDLSGKEKERFARDIFMLSFYFRGMSFIDMAYLRKSDLKNGYLHYRRRKTGQEISIAWTKEMQQILDRYKPNPTQFLLPIITSPEHLPLSQCRRKQYVINKYLKRVGASLDIPIPLTLYCTRHSWASIARSKGVPLNVISNGLGHDNELTTQIYLASLDTAAVDRANALIIKALF